MKNTIIDKFILEHPEVEYFKKGFPNIGKRADNEHFCDAVSKVEEAWHFYDEDLYKIETDHEVIKLGSGSPLSYQAFPLAIDTLKKQLDTPLYAYGAAAGNEDHRNIISKYLIGEGYPNHINYSNVLITNSTTEGFYLILKALFKPYDVILMTAPNYGLFAFMPERMNISVELISLKEENDYLIDPIDLDNRIKEINLNLQTKYKDKLDYVPRVRAFLNINPHNPLGTVMSDKNTDLLNKIGEICLNNDIFIIDDLIYRDLSYDRSHLAKPIGTIESYFDCTISLFGLSKSYGLASTRSGFIVANDAVIRLLRDNLFYVMDSASILQSSLLVGAYQKSEERDIQYNKYFENVISKYKFKLYLCKAMIDGIDSIKDSIYYEGVYDKICSFYGKDNLSNILEGIPYAKTIIMPESGFFLLISFTDLKKTGIINSEKDLLTLFYKNCGIKFLIGQSFSWPNKNDIIARFTYSLDDNLLIDAIGKMNQIIRRYL